MPALKDSACGLGRRGAGERAQAQSRPRGSSVSQALPGLSTASVPCPLRKPQITGEGQACAPRAAGAPRRATALPARQCHPQRPVLSLTVSNPSMPEATRRGRLSGEDPGEAAVPGPLLVWHHTSRDHGWQPHRWAHSRFGPDPSAEPCPAAGICCGRGGWSLEAARPGEGAWEPPQLPLGTAWGLLGREQAEGAAHRWLLGSRPGLTHT